MKEIVPFVICVVFSCISLACCYIRPFKMGVVLSNDSYDEIMLFSKPKIDLEDDLRTIVDFVKRQNISTDMHIKLLEIALHHAVQASACYNNSVLRIQNANQLTHFSDNIGASLRYLNWRDYPLDLLTTNTSPFYYIFTMPDDFIGDEIRFYGSFGPLQELKDLISMCRSINSEAGVVIDVGANVGSVSLYAASLGEKVLAFEPLSSNLRKLRASCALNGFFSHKEDLNSPEQQWERDQIIVIGDGVSDTASNVTITPNWWCGSNSNSGMGMMHNISSKEEFLAREDVQCASILDANDDGEQVSVAPLDWTLEKFGLLVSTSPQQLQEPLQKKSKRPMRSIDVLKLDCEGCEPMALLGARRMFAENPPRFVFAEVNPERLRAGGWEPRSFLRLLESYSYECHSDFATRTHKVSAADPSADIDKMQDLLCTHLSLLA